MLRLRRLRAKTVPSLTPGQGSADPPLSKLPSLAELAMSELTIGSELKQSGESMPHDESTAALPNCGFRDGQNYPAFSWHSCDPPAVRLAILKVAVAKVNGRKTCVDLVRRAVASGRGVLALEGTVYLQGWLRLVFANSGDLAG
jgi:hypothetical protein